MVVKQTTQRPVEDDTAKGETICVWEGQEISLVWDRDFTFLSTVKLGDIIQARGELLVSVRIKKKRKAALNLCLAVAEVEPAKEAPVVEAETADEEPVVDAESTNEAPVAAAESANKAPIVDPESTNKNSHKAEELDSDHRNLVKTTGTGHFRKHSTSSKRARSNSSSSSQALAAMASNTDMAGATTEDDGLSLEEIIYFPGQ
ncbi:hypothetical protein BGZ99_000388 [Dissophora globulifera]|uniref:Uncharacterized protein n=1 Tax=Dissophora globulifera TaxID=979702 RepID=A0A9P6RTQ6_9FUNG|nr:hypothetical protein BGZ99_000388 [Dissophora globulifera]